MLSKLKSFFDKHFTADTPSPEEEQHQLNLAIAAILIELTMIDDEVSSDERETVKDVLKNQLDLPEDEINELKALSKEKLEDATDYYQFTSLINQNFSAEQRAKVIEQMWQVAIADGRIDHHEEHFIRKIADLLFVPHSTYIKVKLKVVDNH